MQRISEGTARGQRIQEFKPGMESWKDWMGGPEVLRLTDALVVDWKGRLDGISSVDFRAL
jgi:hypothetical protein